VAEHPAAPAETALVRAMSLAGDYARAGLP
jgi:hypothetical protein